MRKTALALVALLLVAAPLWAVSPSKKAGSIRILQYNIGNFHKSGEDSMEDVSDLIKRYKADIVSLNEVDSCNHRNPENQLERLAAMLGGWDHHYGKAINYAGGAYGDGIVSPSHFLHREALTLPRFQGSEDRALVIVETDKYVFASTHLCHQKESSRTAQACLINHILMKKYGASRKPVILAGDLNAERGSASIDEFSKFWKIISPEDKTWPSDEAKVSIDFIMVLKNRGITRIRDVKTFAIDPKMDPIVVTASDHLPVVADIRISR